MSVLSPIRSSALALTLTAALAPATATAAPAGPDGRTTLVSVQAATHPADASHPKAYDRIVFTFTGDLPYSWKVTKVKQVSQYGSDEPIKLKGRDLLEVQLHGATAHDEETGKPTFQPGRRAVELGNLREYVFTGDHAALTTFGLGLKKYTKVTSFKLAGPNRVVLDIPTS